MRAEPDVVSAIKPPPIDQVISITRSMWTDEYAALYAYGSTARDEMDAWSDLDVCLVTKSGNHLETIRNWMIRMNQEFGQKVDAVGLPENLLFNGAPWDLSFVLWSLREKSRILIGHDIRDAIQMPSIRKLQLSSAMVTMASVRRIYGLSRDQVISKLLPSVDLPSNWTCPAGNLAWAICTAALHLLRAILFFEDGVLVSTKAAIGEELQSRGEKTLAGYVSTVLDLRKQVPRYDPLPYIPEMVKQLVTAIPALVQRLGDDLSDAGLQDPTHEPNGKPLYDADGFLYQKL